MPESTGPHGPNGTDGPDDDTPNVANGAGDNTDTGAVTRPPESFGTGENNNDDSRDFDETIITREASGRYEPTELTGPTGDLRPAEEVQPPMDEPEELRVVPINPVPVEREPADPEPAGSGATGSNWSDEAPKYAGPPAPNYAAPTYAAPRAPSPVEPVALGPVPLQPYYAEFPEQDTPPEQPDEVAQRPRPERIKRAAVMGVRVAVGVVGVVVAAAVVTGAALLPLPSFTAAVPSLEVTPVETGQELVCAGSILELSESADTDASATSPIGQPGVVSASSRGTITTTPFAASDAGSGGTDAAPRLLASAIEATEAGDEPALVSGAQWQWVDTDDAYGLAAANCGVASADTWLVGGATTTGRSTLILLSNPSSVAATVDLEIFGELGAISAPGLTEISVAPGDQRVLSLAGFAPQLASPVVHVTSTGGLVLANLQQTTIRGIEPGGVDLIGASAAPSTTTVIPGVRISGADVVGSRLGAAGYEDLAPTLRVYVPGTEAVDAQVSVQLEGEAAPVSSYDVQVEGGVTIDIPIDDLVDGNYSITVVADSPVIAAARVATVNADGDRSDFAWVPGASELNQASMVSTPRGFNVALHLANPTTETATVEVTAVAGSDSVGTDTATRTVEIAAGATVRMDADAGASYELSGLDGLRASVTAATDGGVAAYAAVPREESSTPIEIFP